MWIVEMYRKLEGPNVDGDSLEIFVRNYRRHASEDVEGDLQAAGVLVERFKAQHHVRELDGAPVRENRELTQEFLAGALGMWYDMRVED